jgi:hypothetical protein
MSMKPKSLRSQRTLRNGAGIVDQEIDFAALAGERHRIRRVGQVCGVAVDFHGVLAQDAGAGGVQVAGAARGEVQMTAFRRQHLRDAQTDAARSAGDQCLLTLQPQFHAWSPLQRRDLATAARY